MVGIFRNHLGKTASACMTDYTRAKGDLVKALCGYNAGNVCINNPNSKRARIVKKNYSFSIINLANEIKEIAKEKFYEEYLFYDKVVDDYDNLD